MLLIETRLRYKRVIVESNHFPIGSKLNDAELLDEYDMITNTAMQHFLPLNQSLSTNSETQKSAS